MNARLSIWSSYYVELEIEDAIERFIKNGIFASELSDEHGLMLLERDNDVKRTGLGLREFINARNFEMSQGHLWLKIKICSDKDAVEKLFKWIDLYEAIGIKNMVLHCDNLADTDLTYDEKIRRNTEALRTVAQYVKDKDVTICIENLRLQFLPHTVDEILHILDEIGSDRFGICLDTGHLNITDKDQRGFILKAGKHLKALHIADNQGEADQHMMPFGKGNVDFFEVVAALREIGYNGLFNYEIPGESHIPIELRDEKLKFIKAGYEYLMKQ